MQKFKSRGLIGILAASMLLMMSCGTLFTKGGGDYRAGEKAYKAKDYATAVEGAIAALEANPEFEEAQDLFRRAFPKATEALEGQITQIKNSNEKFPNEKIAPLYERLSDIHARADKLNVEAEIKDYSAQLKLAQEGILEDRYQAGIAALNEGGYQNARLAESYLDFVRQRQSDYKDINYYLNQAWDASVAKLTIYAPEKLGNLATELGNQLKKNKQLNDVNNLVASSSLGVGQNASASEVVAAAKNQGIDMVLYITGATSKEVAPLSETEKELSSGIPGTVLTASYAAGISGTWQIIDTATGQVRSQNNFSTSVNEKLYVEALKATGREKHENVGSLQERTVPVTKIASFGGILGKPFIAIMKTASFNDERKSEPEQYKSLTLNRITENLKGVWLFNNVYVVYEEEGSGTIYPDMDSPYSWDKIIAAANKNAAIYQNIKQNVSNNLNRWADGAERSMPGKAVDVLYRATAGPLQK